MVTAVDALKDEWLAERKVQLLIDKGQFRTRQRPAPDHRISKRSIRPTVVPVYGGKFVKSCRCSPIPRQLGEDQLARFGAYREYD